jgi:hypothetical protein
MASPLNQMLAIVFTLLQRKDMFPPNSSVVPSHSNPAMVMIIRPSRLTCWKYIPLSILIPQHWLVKAYPTQENITLWQYYGHFVDYQQLWAYVSNITDFVDEANSQNKRA